MQKKINCLIFSDFEIPCYKRVYRGVLFIDKAKDSRYNFTIVSPYTNTKFINKKANIKKHYYKLLFSESNFQYSFIKRIERLIKLFIKILKLKNQKFDVIYIGATYLLPIAKILKTKDTKIIVNVCDFYSDLYEEYKMPLGKTISKIIKVLEKNFLQVADVITVDTYAHKEILVSKYNINDGRCVVLPNGISVEEFPFTKSKNTEILLKYKFDIKDTILFYGGDISNSDNIEMILKFANEYKEIQNLKFLIIGKGNQKYLKSLNDYILNNQLQEKVIIDGFKPYKDLHKFLSIADICLAPFKITATTNVTESSKIITYLLSGKKILATNADGVKSLYGSYIHYFENDNYNQFKNKILELLDIKLGDEEIKNIRNHGLKFDFNNIINQEYKLIDDLILGKDISIYNFSLKNFSKTE